MEHGMVKLAFGVIAINIIIGLLSLANEITFLVNQWRVQAFIYQYVSPSSNTIHS